MADTVSTFRTVRLIIQPPVNRRSRTHWALHATATIRGVPHTRVLREGYVEHLGHDCSEGDVWAAISEILEHVRSRG